MSNTLRNLADGINPNTVIDEYSDKLTKYIKIGASSSSLLLALVEDILNLSKMDAGTFAINIEEFWVKDLINEVYDMFSYQCNQKQIDLSIKFDPRLHKRKVFSDRSRIKQVFLNLLSNALKFTFEGHIKISTQCVNMNGKDMIEFKVEDTGIGIKDEDQDKLFKLFGMVKHESNKRLQKYKINPNG